MTPSETWTRILYLGDSSFTDNSTTWINGYTESGYRIVLTLHSSKSLRHMLYLIRDGGIGSGLQVAKYLTAYKTELVRRFQIPAEITAPSYFTLLVGEKIKKKKPVWGKYIWQEKYVLNPGEIFQPEDTIFTVKYHSINNICS